MHTEPSSPEPTAALSRAFDGPSTSSVRWAIAYLLVAIPVCFTWLSKNDVVAMEGIVADGARTMHRSGDWLVPRLYGEVYAFKPALTYWLAAVSTRVFGESEFSLRFPVALCAALMGAVIMRLIATTAGAPAGFFAGIAAITAPIVVQKARIAEFDMPFAAGVGVAVAAACANLARMQARVSTWGLGYAALAFAFLAKGPLALALYVPGLVVAALVTRRNRRLLAAGHVVGVMVCMGLIGAYLAAVYSTYGLAAFEQSLEEARKRTSGWDFAAISVSAAKPLIALAIFAPWSLVALMTLVPGFHRGQPQESRFIALAAWSFLACGIFVFVIIPTYQTRYFLPLAAPFGILAGVTLAAASKRAAPGSQLPPWAVALGAFAVIVAGLALAGAAWASVQTRLWPMSLTERVVLMATAMTVLGALIVVLRRPPSEWPRRAGTLLALAAVALAGVDIFLIQPRRAASRTLRAVAESFTPHLPGSEPVWVDFDDDHSSLVYYLRREARGFRRTGGWPPPGSVLILLPAQLAELRALDETPPIELERVRRGSLEFILCRR